MLRFNKIKFLKTTCGVMPQVVFLSRESVAVCAALLVLARLFSLVEQHIWQVARLGILKHTDSNVAMQDPAQPCPMKGYETESI